MKLLLVKLKIVTILFSFNIYNPKGNIFFCVDMSILMGKKEDLMPLNGDFFKVC